MYVTPRSTHFSIALTHSLWKNPFILIPNQINLSDIHWIGDSTLVNNNLFVVVSGTYILGPSDYFLHCWGYLYFGELDWVLYHHYCRNIVYIGNIWHNFGEFCSILLVDFFDINQCKKLDLKKSDIDYHFIFYFDTVFTSILKRDLHIQFDFLFLLVSQIKVSLW